MTAKKAKAAWDDARWDAEIRDMKERLKGVHPKARAMGRTLLRCLAAMRRLTESSKWMVEAALALEKRMAETDRRLDAAWRVFDIAKELLDAAAGVKPLKLWTPGKKRS
jgi:hypothetical protein